MQYFSAYTDQCLKDARKFNLTEELNKVVAKIEKNQTSRFLEKYRSPALVKRAGAYRFIGYELINDNFIFIIFLRILLKGRKEYEEFCNDSDRYCRNILPDEFWISDIINKKKNSEAKEKPELNEVEKSYLFSPIPDDFTGSLMIYESKRFVSEIQKSDYKIHFAEIIRDILDDKVVNKNYFKKHKQHSNLIIYYKLLDDINILFLFQAINVNNNEKFDEDDFLRIVNTSNSEESIMQESLRTYPEYVLYDENIWLEIQNESEGNLALSTEEASILNSILHHKDDTPLFPLFINGRAGSGKSTLLYYTFAHILLNHILNSNRLNLPPLFLTYSSKLLETANHTIKKILKTNTKIRLRLQNDVDKSKMVDEYLDSQDYNKSFKTFRDFQRELLNSDIQAQFSDENYYNFSKFKDDWSNYSKKNPSSSIRRITSEFAWYIIRTFIKGMRTSADDSLDPDDYINLPRDLKTIDEQTYKIIFDEVFIRWYKDYLRENNFWDDQDLTRCVLDNQDDLDFEFTAVFCDEAQDFSVIELELISLLPIYSRRKLNYSDIKRIPLAFAGDPLQTINPTGFRWSSIKANFYEKINNELDSSKKISINYKELNNNYRSSKPIVIFNNIIQLIRAILFNMTDVAPQRAWFSSSPYISPTLKIDDLSIITEALKEENKTKTIIIPCEEDQEKDFILNRDSFLKNQALRGNEIVQNIWSPMNVKGLEYNTVIVYNFGDYLASSIGININQYLTELVESNDFKQNLEEYKRIQLEYFFNKLYVATSRAKKNLVIVDSKMGYDYLWSIFNNLLKSLTSYFSLYLNDKIVWEKESEISDFQFTSEILELADDKPEDLAKQLYYDGINTSNPRKLKSAAEYFKAAQKPNESYRALAKAYELENNYFKACEYYEKIRDADKATKCLWLTNEKSKYSKILEVQRRLPENPNNIFKLAAEFMLITDKKNNSILYFRNFQKLIRNSENPEFYLLTDKSWDDFYKEVINALVEYSYDNPNLSDWDEVLEIFRNLFQKGILLKFRKNFVSILFNLKQYKDVIDELIELNDTENELFIKANADYLKYPAKLEYLYKLNEYGQIAFLFLENSESSIDLTKQHLELILSSLLNTSDTNTLEKFVIKIGKKLNVLLNEKFLDKIFLYCFDKGIYMLGFTIIELLDDRKEDEFYVNFLKSIFSKNDKNLVNYILALFIYQEFIYNRFHTILDILENKRVELNFIPKDLINNLLLEKLLLQKLSLAERITAKPEPKKRMQEYIKNLLLNSDRWMEIVSVKIAGTAIEKLEFHINARDFYEKIIKGNYSEADKEFARLRWLKVKEKQAMIGPENAKQQLLEDIQKNIKKWGFDDVQLSEIPDFPEISEKFIFSFDELYYNHNLIEVKALIDFKVQISIEGKETFIIKKISEKSLLKIENLILDETTYFDLNSLQFESKESKIILEKSDEVVKEYEIQNWDLIITYFREEESKKLAFYHKSSNYKIIEIPI